MLWVLVIGGVLLIRSAAAQTNPIVKNGTAVLLEDYVSLPLSSRTPDTFNYSNFPPSIDFNEQLARVNFLRSEPPNAPGSATRFFVCDLNRNLYILDKTNKTFTIYLPFESTFSKFDNNPGFAGGLITLAFDPAYVSNGIFYTVHMENPNKGNAGSDPTNSNIVLPAGYAPTGVINPPAGNVSRQSVLVEWKDTNITNNTFEGTARELLRVAFTDRIHPMGDLMFNPLAQPGDSDYRNLYIAVGDGGAGESSVTTDDGAPGVSGGDRHFFPQRLDTLLGKILRITPDTNLHPADLLGTNKCYRVPSTGPDQNPFAFTNGARPEIFAYGFRNPHRFSWDPVSNRIFANDIGRFTFEEVNLIEKGNNYGWAEREGTRRYFPTKSSLDWPPGTDTSAIPTPDLLNLRYGASNFLGTVTPFYPVAEYYQDQGDAISSGFAYRGSLPRLYGKYVFGDITTGRLLYSDLGEMIAAHDTNATTLAEVHELQVVYANTHTNGPAIKRRLFDVVADEYDFKGGTNPNRLPGGADVTGGDDNDGIPYGGGRADIRLAMPGDGELYVLSKSDGLIRRITAVVGPPIIESIVATNGTVSLTWQSIIGESYRIQHKGSLTEAWANLPGDVTATNALASKDDALTGTNRFYRILVLP